MPGLWLASPVSLRGTTLAILFLDPERRRLACALFCLFAAAGTPLPVCALLRAIARYFTAIALSKRIRRH
jgi:hypothetical protein